MQLCAWFKLSLIAKARAVYRRIRESSVYCLLISYHVTVFYRIVTLRIRSLDIVNVLNQLLLIGGRD